VEYDDDARRDAGKDKRPPIMAWPDVALPHAAVAIAGAVLFVVHSLWWKLA
jgi:hypothetical protein